jgi:hypothetical protein
VADDDERAFDLGGLEESVHVGGDALVAVAVDVVGLGRVGVPNLAGHDDPPAALGPGLDLIPPAVPSSLCQHLRCVLRCGVPKVREPCESI